MKTAEPIDETLPEPDVVKEQLPAHSCYLDCIDSGYGSKAKCFEICYGAHIRNEQLK